MLDKLRPEQVEARDTCVDALLSDEKCALLVFPTGVGKSLTGYAIADTLLKMSFRGVFIVDNITLVKQVLESARELFHDVGSVCGSLEEEDTPNAPFVVGTIQTLIRRKDIPQFDFIMIDEAHVVDSVKENSQYMRFLREQKNVMLFGMTATPYRATGGFIYGEGMLWPRITYNKDLLWAIENKRLAKPTLKWTPVQFDTSKLHMKMGDFDLKEAEALTKNQDKINAQIDDALPKLIGRKKVLWHCVSIEHAENVCRLLKERGEDAVVIHSNLKDYEKEMNYFKQSGRHLIFIMLLTKGWDFPAADALVLMRVMRSPTLYVQVCGRVLRTFPGKPDALILDYGEIVKNCGPLNAPFIRSKRATTPQIKIDMKFCPECLEYLEKSADVCHACGHDFVKAALEKQRQYMSSLTRKADATGKLLHGEQDNYKWIIVDPKRTQVRFYKSKKGTDCVQINFFVRGSLFKKYTKYISIDPSSPWMRASAHKKISQIMRTPIIAGSAQEYVDKLNKIGMEHITEIQVYEAGKYPDIVRYRSAS